MTTDKEELVPSHVSPEVARRIFERLKQDGSLEVVLQFMRDHVATMKDRIKIGVLHVDIEDRKEVGKLYEMRGEVKGIERLIRVFNILGTRGSDMELDEIKRVGIEEAEPET